MVDIQQFLKERDEAMFSLDKSKILAYCQKYQVPLPKSELAFWAGVHKCIYSVRTATPEQKENSKQWLLQHGFSLEINNAHYTHFLLTFMRIVCIM